MLFGFTLFLFAIIVVIDVIHYGALFLFLNRIHRIEWQKPQGKYTPNTLVLLPLRGADPSLAKGLEKVLSQDYPNYHVQILLDSAEDSALPFVESAIKQSGKQNAEVKIIDEHFSTCVLKCNALYHAVAELDPSYEAVVILDADTNPPADWLRRLVEPLSDPRFPAATGLRWYIPEKANAGSLVRYLWNAAAIVQQQLYRIVWGGSMVLRRDLLKDSNLLEQWKHALADDTLVLPVVQQIKGNVAVVPSLFLANRESCTLSSFHRWVKRQMLSAKLYHPAWGAIIGQAVLLTLPLLLLAGTFVAGLFLHDSQTVLWSVLAFLLYWGGVFGTVPTMELVIRRIVQEHGETVKQWSLSRTLFTFMMVPVTQVTYTSALFWLHFLRRLEWRGIEYELTGKTIRLVEYKPYTAKPDEKGHSL